MSNPIINLRISGTKRRQGGFTPLVNVGVLPWVEGDNMDRVPLVAEKPTYIVKHAADYVLYLLIDRQVKSCDADAPGVLSIAVAISSDLQLANNASPYRLLREIYEKFLSTYMIPVSDGRHSFIDVDNDSEIFRELLSGYSLEKRKTAYIRMNPEGLTGILCVAPADLEEFFKNTQYKEFSAFKDVEVGVACTAQVTHGLTNLQIPLPSAVYDIYVNDVKTGATMQSPSDSEEKVMATYLNLSLQIYGGAAGKDFYRQPYVEVGCIPKTFSATAPVLINESEVWMLTHAQEYTLYELCSRGASLADDRQGQFLICLFIPSRERLAGGRSPLELLEAVWDQFVVNDLRDGILPQSPVDAAPYKALLDKYRLEERSLLLPVMQGDAPTSFCVDSWEHLDALMRHSRYPALTSVGRLELGFNCPSGIDLTGREASCKTPNMNNSQAEKAIPECPSSPEGEAQVREQKQQGESGKQVPAENARKELIDKNWRWYFWLFFPLTYLLSVEKSRQKKVLLSYLLHPALLQYLAFLLVWAFGDSKNFSKDFIWLFLVVFAFYGISSLLIIPAARKFTEAYNISLMRMVFLTIMYLCSLGIIFQFSTTIAFVVSFIGWVVYMADKSLNVDKAIKVCFNIWYVLQVLWFVLGGLFLFFIIWLFSNADFS